MSDDLIRQLRSWAGDSLAAEDEGEAAFFNKTASALEAKDAEIARLNKCYDLAIKSRIEWREQAERLERQLAEETERCARIAESFDMPLQRGGMKPQVIEVEKIIAAAIRGGAK